MDVTCCVRLLTLLHVVACCWELLRKAGLKRVKHLATRKQTQRARPIQPKFPEISVQNSMDRFGPTGKDSKKKINLLRWTIFPARSEIVVEWIAVNSFQQCWELSAN